MAKIFLPHFLLHTLPHFLLHTAESSVRPKGVLLSILLSCEPRLPS